MNRMKHFLTSVWQKHYLPVSWYRLSLSLIACAYLWYFAARNSVGSWYLGAVVLLTIFILDDCLQALKSPRKTNAGPLSIR